MAPVRLIVRDDLRRERGTAFFRGWLALPFMVWVGLYAIAAFFAAIANWAATLFTGRPPAALHRFVREDGMRLTDLAEHACMTKQSCGELVDELVKNGYVERIPDPEDRRAKLIVLTERGKEAQRFGYSLFAELEERWAERFGAERLEQLREVLEDIASSEAPEAVPELARQAEQAAA